MGFHILCRIRCQLYHAVYRPWGVGVPAAGTARILDAPDLCRPPHAQGIPSWNRSQIRGSSYKDLEIQHTDERDNPVRCIVDACTRTLAEKE